MPDIVRRRHYLLTIGVKKNLFLFFVFFVFSSGSDLQCGILSCSLSSGWMVGWRDGEWVWFGLVIIGGLSV